MDKYKLTRFIDKYHLGGNVNAVVINSKGDTLSTRFITGDKALLGVLDDDVSLNLTQSGDKAIALEISDQYSKVNFMLSDKSVINQPPALKGIPEFQIQIKVDSNFIQRFIGGKSALPDTDTFTVITSDDEVKLIEHEKIKTESQGETPQTPDTETGSKPHPG